MEIKRINKHEIQIDGTTYYSEGQYYWNTFLLCGIIGILLFFMARPYL
jgi:hypothetical protein